MERISYGRRLGMLAAEHPSRQAVVFVNRDGDERPVSWQELERSSNRVARLLDACGIGPGSLVAVAFPNRPEHLFADFAVWKLGATVLSLRAALPAPERDAILATADPSLVISDWEGITHPRLTSADVLGATRFFDAQLPFERVSSPAVALASGGSTGRPKVIVMPGSTAMAIGTMPMRLAPMGFAAGDVQLVAGPLYHSMPFNYALYGLFEDHTLVLMEAFDAERIVNLIERYRVSFAYLSPTMMRRIALLSGISDRDLTSLRAIVSTGAPCPPWLKGAWIDLIGAEKVHEVYGATELVGLVVIRGDEWLEHSGSVGRPYRTETRILDDGGHELPPGEIGEIYMRNIDVKGVPYRYLGAEPAPMTADGYISVGDFGWLDAGGYLYIADRRVDMIVTGGANVYPAEVEAALSDHPGIADLVVIGLPDDEWGRRIHALIQPQDPANLPGVAELRAHVRGRLAAYKVPKTWEIVAALPRSEAGKINRSALIVERS